MIDTQGQALGKGVLYRDLTSFGWVGDIIVVRRTGELRVVFILIQCIKDNYIDNVRINTFQKILFQFGCYSPDPIHYFHKGENAESNKQGKVSS